MGKASRSAVGVAGRGFTVWLCEPPGTQIVMVNGWYKAAPSSAVSRRQQRLMWAAETNPEHAAYLGALAAETNPQHAALLRALA